MAGEWRDTNLGDVVRLQRGHDLPDKERTPGHVPVMGSFGVTGWHNEARAQGPGVTIGRSGASIGVVSFVREDYWPLNTCLYMTDFQGNDPRFCYYWLSTLNLANYNSGSAQPSLNRNYIYGMLVRIPEADEQRTIAHILGTLDDKIELNQRMNETLEAMTQAIFQSWFVDFDPVRAKTEGRDPGLPKDIADLFPDRFKDSELSEIPKGWRLAPLPEVIDVNPPRTLRRGEVAPYLDMAHMPTRGHSPDAVVERAFGSGMRFVNGDTLVARITPCLENGKTAFVDFLQEGQIGWGSTEYIVLRPKPPLPTEYAYCLARSTDLRDFAIQSMIGSSGRQRVPAESLSHFMVSSPSEEVADLFGKLVKPLFARAREATEEGRTLAALRDTLLPKLVSGELRVKDAERLLEVQP